MSSDRWINTIASCSTCKHWFFEFKPSKDSGKTLLEFYREHYNCEKKNKDNINIAWRYIEKERVISYASLLAGLPK